MKKLLLKLLGLATLMSSLFAGWWWMDIKQFAERPVTLAEPTVLFNVPAGVGFFKVAYDLERAGIIPSAKKFLWMLRLEDKSGDIKTGEYEIHAGITTSALADLFISGKVKQYYLTVVEGWTYKQLVEALAAHPKISRTLEGKDVAQIAAEIGIVGGFVEGYFLPDTYRFTAGTTDLAFLKRAYKEMQQEVEQQWNRRAADLPYRTPYEALIMASIVEKETGAASEREQIAGVFVRRLQKGMRLQTDPTVIYGMGDAYNGNIRKKDLLTDTPYNTYLRKGLPPTPIALPGRDAIRAALNPAPGKELYFVAKGDGSHYFSATIEEHNAAVKQYQVKQRSKEYRSAPAAATIP